ncbi:MAG: glucose-6-phosphate dehydrogenase assembly protein OpcA [Armatimonadota bacterium]
MSTTSDKMKIKTPEDLQKYINKKYSAIFFGDESTTYFKADTLNLIIYAGNESTKLATQISEFIVAMFSCRAIVLSKSKKYNDAYVSLVCNEFQSDDRKICGEVISVEYTEDSLTSLGIVFPYLIADEPIVTLLLSSLSEWSIVIEDLVSISDFLVIDSRNEIEPFESIKHIQETISSNNLKCLLYDISWIELDNIRETIASIFDDKNYRNLILNEKKIYITICNDTLSSSMVLASWFARILNMKLSDVKKEDNYYLCFYDDNKQLEITIQKTSKFHFIINIGSCSFYIGEEYKNSDEYTLSKQISKEKSPIIDGLSHILATRKYDIVYSKSMDIVLNIWDKIKMLGNINETNQV